MASKIPKCRSTRIPCPAGDRCPEHRGRAKAIQEALANSDIETASLLKKEELDRDEKAKLAAFMASVVIKPRRDGSTKVTIPEQTPIAEANMGNKKVTFSKIKKRVIEVPAVHPADAVDQTELIRLSDNMKGTTSDRFNEALEQLYDGHVTIDAKSKTSTYVIDSLHVDDDYKGHNVAGHVLASFVGRHRPDLYDFFSKDESIPYQEYAHAGFEPNPYYWAGKTHPETGVTYQSEETLDKINNDRDSEHYHSLGFYHLNEAKRHKDSPYMRISPTLGWRFSDIPNNYKEYSREQVREIYSNWAERGDRVRNALSWIRDGKYDLT